MIIYLCGFMGCGKTTVGRKLAQLMNYRFIDLDEYIEKSEGTTISDMFMNKGEEYFRAAETEAIKNCCTGNTVVATGGGAMVNKVNADEAKKIGKVVFLDVPFETCYNRIKNSKTRPLVKTYEQLEKLYEERLSSYRKNCDIDFVPEGNAKNIAFELKKLLQ